MLVLARRERVRRPPALALVSAASEPSAGSAAITPSHQ
jgi:hypothetical protein